MESRIQRQIRKFQSFFRSETNERHEKCPAFSFKGGYVFKKLYGWKLLATSPKYNAISTSTRLLTSTGLRKIVMNYDGNVNCQIPNRIFRSYHQCTHSQFVLELKSVYAKLHHVCDRIQKRAFEIFTKLKITLSACTKNPFSIFQPLPSF